MGFVNKIANVFGSGEYKPKREDFTNPYSKKFIANDRKLAADYNNIAESDRNAFLQSMERLTGQGKVLEEQSAGYNPLIETLSAASRGEGPSLVEGQLMKTLNRNVAQQLGLAAGNETINPALAARMAMANTANLNQQTAFDASQARLEEILNARNQEIAARNAQTGTTQVAADVYGNSGNQFSNIRNQSLNAGINYQEMAELLAERDRQAKMGFNTSNQQGFDSGQKRRGEFWSKLASGVASATAGGAA